MSGRYDETGACRACGKCPVADDSLVWYRGVDACLGLLPDVVQACCGHAGAAHPYVVIAPGNAPGTMLPSIVGRYYKLHGRAALAYFESLDVGPPCTPDVSMDNPYTRTRTQASKLYADIGFDPPSLAAPA